MKIFKRKSNKPNELPATRIRMVEGINGIAYIPLSEFTKVWHKCLDWNNPIQIIESDGTSWNINPFQIIYVEEAEDPR